MVSFSFLLQFCTVSDYAYSGKLKMRFENNTALLKTEIHL